MKKIKIQRHKLRELKPTKNPFLSLARSIIYQQISTKAGNAIYARFIKLFSKKKPSAKTLGEISDKDLRGAGISPQKLSYLRDLSAKFLDETIEPKKFRKMSDEEIIEHLVRVKGIGTWTAHMFLIFALNRPNVLPTGDLAIVKGFQKAFGLRKLPNEKQMGKLAKPHEGHYTELCLYLWDLLDN